MLQMSSVTQCFQVFCAALDSAMKLWQKRACTWAGTHNRDVNALPNLGAWGLTEKVWHILRSLAVTKNLHYSLLNIGQWQLVTLLCLYTCTLWLVNTSTKFFDLPDIYFQHIKWETQKTA